MFNRKVIGWALIDNLTTEASNVKARDMAVKINDKKLSEVEGNGNLSYFEAEVLVYNDYYPSGMTLPGRHGNTMDYMYGFHGQEMDNEVIPDGLFLNFDFRSYDPMIGRFSRIDPLAAKYTYNSTYAFQENKLGIGTELEGKEVKRHEWLDENKRNHVDYTADIKVYNNSSASTAEVIEYAIGVANSIEDDFNGEDSDGNIVSTSVNLEFTDKVDAEKDYYIEFTDHVESKISSDGIVNEIGNSEVNRIQLLIPGKAAGSIYEKVTKEGLFTTGAHEFGHTVGLRHQEHGSNITKNNIILQNSNLMYYTHSIDRQNGGVNSSQLSEMRNNVNLDFLVDFNKWLRSLD